MQKTIEEIYSSEIYQNLNLAKEHVNTLILDVESNTDWLTLHQDIKVVIFSMRNVIDALAKRHIAICVFGKYKKSKLRLQTNDINEVIKVYRYLG